jgi:hypothetical protein
MTTTTEYEQAKIEGMEAAAKVCDRMKEEMNNAWQTSGNAEFETAYRNRAIQASADAAAIRVTASNISKGMAKR